MSEKPKSGVFSQLLKHIIPGEKSSTRTRYCEKGHPMDANWTTCPYCEAEKRKNDKSIIRTTTKSDQIDKGETPQRSADMERGTTKIGTGSPEEPDGRTRFDTSPEQVSEKKVVGRERRITGVLVTFSHKYQGELFVLYEGRNVMGSGSSCDISINWDRLVSGEHAMILCRAGRDELHDMLSTNGTFLNEEYVGTKGADLADGAMIRIGSTVFEFRKITSGAGKGPGEKAEPSEEDSELRPPGETDF
ncbi:MAG TPA: FHA domain-containing protein [Nitrosospira sp.]|nr:FHA domain-containing protein [Nitrosospira sp.]